MSTDQPQRRIFPEVDPRAATARGYPYPLRSWPPDAAIDIQNLAEAINDDIPKVGVLAYANATARNTAIPTPAEGQLCWLLDIHQLQGYWGAWKPVGGQMPGCFVRKTAGTAFSAGTNHLAFTPDTATYYPGMRAGSAGYSLMVDMPGRYSIQVRGNFGGGGKGVLGFGPTSGATFWGATVNADASQNGRSECTSIATLATGTEYVGWFSSTVASFSISEIQVSAIYAGMS